MGPLREDPHGVGGGEREARSVLFYEGLRVWEARFVMYYEGLRLWGGSGSNEAKALGGSAKEGSSRAWGEGEGEGGAGTIMRSNDVGSYELKLTPREMQMEKVQHT